ncbi:MAG: transcription elongation factor GreA [Patescibacteria group bacterium]|nr:transcription elongation factor GreA [Patescibacteria group bacterium]
MSKKTLLTAEGLADIQAELANLKEVRRIEIAEKLKEAISFGDLSENSEYEDARNEQAQVELRIIELEDILKNYELVDSKKAAKKRDVVAIGSTVVVKNADGEKETYKIVGPTETDIFEGKISNESPIGSALIGKVLGETAVGKSLGGAFSFEIVELR